MSIWIYHVSAVSSVFSYKILKDRSCLKKGHYRVVGISVFIAFLEQNAMTIRNKRVSPHAALDFFTSLYNNAGFYFVSQLNIILYVEIQIFMQHSYPSYEISSKIVSLKKNLIKILLNWINGDVEIKLQAVNSFLITIFT